MMQHGDRKLVESTPIEAYLCRQLGYSRSDPYEQYLVESVVSLRNAFVSEFYKRAFPIFDEEGLMKWYDESLAKWIGWFEGRLQNNTGFFVGNSPSHADFAVFQLSLIHI